MKLFALLALVALSSSMISASPLPAAQGQATSDPLKLVRRPLPTRANPKLVRPGREPLVSSPTTVAAAVEPSSSTSEAQSSSSSIPSSSSKTSSKSSSSKKTSTKTTSTKTTSTKSSSTKASSNVISTPAPTSTSAPAPEPVVTISEYMAPFPESTDVVFAGQATWYNVGLGACGLWNNDSEDIVAVSQLLYDNFPGATPWNPNLNPVCNQRMRVTYGQKSVVVQVRDRCVGCEQRHIDLSPAAFKKLAPLDDGYLQNIQFQWL